MIIYEYSPPWPIIVLAIRPCRELRGQLKRSKNNRKIGKIQNDYVGFKDLGAYIVKYFYVHLVLIGEHIGAPKCMAARELSLVKRIVFLGREKRYCVHPGRHD